MHSKKIIALWLVGALSLAGCASIVGKSDFPVTINSNPPGANILITDEKGTPMFSGTTPITVMLSSGEAYFHAKTYHIAFSRSGYAQQHAQIKAGLSGWYFGNILFGGLIGLLIVDPLTGKMWKLPTQTTVNMAEKTVLNRKKSVLQIATLDQIPKSLRNSLVRLN